MNSLPVKIKLNSITCHQSGSGTDSSKPYLWVIFFKVDGSCVKLTNEFKIDGEATFNFSKGSHGNLVSESVRRDDIIKIPDVIGEWNTRLEPLLVPYFEKYMPGLLGVIGVLMEEDNVSDDGAEAGRIALNNFIMEIVNDALKKFDPKKVDLQNIQQSIKIYFDEKVSKYTDGIEDMVGKAVQDSQSLIENIWSLADKDDLLGYEIWNFNNSQLEESDGSIPFSRRWTDSKHGDWELKGEVKSK